MYNSKQELIKARNISEMGFNKNIIYIHVNIISKVYSDEYYLENA